VQFRWQPHSSRLSFINPLSHRRKIILRKHGQINTLRIGVDINIGEFDNQICGHNRTGIEMNFNIHDAN
jgi:hypothetical protein